MHNLKIIDMSLEELEKLIQDLSHVREIDENVDASTILADARELHGFLKNEDAEGFFAKTLQMEIDNEVLESLMEAAKKGEL